MTVRISNVETSRIHEASDSHFRKIKPCSTLLHKLLVFILSYLKSVLRNTFLILDTCHPDTLYLHEQGSEDSWLFFEARRGPRVKKFGKSWARRLVYADLVRHYE